MADLVITTQYTENDFKEAARRMTLRRAPKVLPIVWGTILFLSLAFKGDDTWATVIVSAALGILLASPLFVLLIYAISGRRSVRMSRRVNPGIFDAPSTLTFSDDGLDIVTPNVSTHRAWNAMSGYLETKTMVGLFAGVSSAMHVVPKRDIPAVDEFRTLLQRHELKPAKLFAFSG